MTLGIDYRGRTFAEQAALYLAHHDRKAPTMGNVNSCPFRPLYSECGGACICRAKVECSFGSRGIVVGSRVRVEHRERDEFAEFTVAVVIPGTRGGVVAVKPGDKGRGYKATEYKLTVLAAPLPTAEGLYVRKGIRETVAATVYGLSGSTWRKWHTDGTRVSVIPAKALAYEVGVDGLVPLKVAA